MKKIYDGKYRWPIVKLSLHSLFCILPSAFFIPHPYLLSLLDPTGCASSFWPELGSGVYFWKSLPH